FLVRYTRHIRHAHLAGLGIVAAAVLSGLANTALIALVNQVINSEGARRTSLLPLFLGVCVAFPVLRFVGDWLLIFLSEKATLHLRMTMCRRILAVPLRTLEELGASRVYTTVTQDLPSVIGAMTLIPLLTLNLTIVAGCLAFMGFLSPKMLGGVLVFLVVGVVAYQIPLIRGHAHVKLLRDRADDLFRHFRSLTDGIKELKLHHERRRAFLEDEMQGTAIQVQKHTVAAQRLFSSAVSFGQVLIFLLIGVVAFVLPSLGAIETPVLTGFTFAILYMVGPVQVVLNSLAQLSRAIVSMDRVEQMGLKLDQAARPEQRQVPATSGGWRSLELEGVTHTYRSERDGSAFTLGPVDLAFRPGEIVFITGGNGSGKTTFAKLLTGLYTPESGRVRLDGEVLDEADMDRYHSLFSVVFSDFFLFDRLLGLGREGLDEQALHYLRELQLDHKVKVEEGRFSSTDLSTGQRKRLALLTAYLEDRPIYLFDEWAADQDPHFKNVFYHELLPALRARGKTVFAISHDDRFYPVADRLIKLDYGQVVLDTPMDGVLPVEVRLAGALSAPADTEADAEPVVQGA
ncbi:MAG TPA: cyclic peptide export ABC transporter, partial [Longimicrobium sp.]